MASPPSTMSWLTDSQLYLHSSADGVVHVWRSKKATSVLVPMKANDFDDLGKVTNHQDLVQNLIKWDETKYRALVKYISARRLLVNREGLVIVELYQFGEDGKIDSNADPIFIRSYDIMQLDTYVNCFQMQTVPFRPMQYLDADPEMEVSSVSSPNDQVLKDEVNKLAAELLAQTNEVAELKTMNSTLESNLATANTELNLQTQKVADLESKVTVLEDELAKTTADLATRTTEVADLESEKQTLEGDIAKLSTDLAAQTNEAAALREELNQVKSTLEKKIEELEMKNEALEETVKKLTEEANNSSSAEADNSPPAWLLADPPKKDWAMIEDLVDYTEDDLYEVSSVGSRGTYTTDDGSTNVKASYFVPMVVKGQTETYKAVALKDLAPHQEKARFSYNWVVIDYNGAKYVHRS